MSRRACLFRVLAWSITSGISAHSSNLRLREAGAWGYGDVQPNIAEALLEPVPGAVGELVWGDKAKAEAEVASITVVDAEQPRLFSFRWVYPLGEVATPANSLLVTFELVPSGTGTVVRLTEVGFREMGWEAAVLEEQYKEHSVGWDTHFASLRDYLRQLVAAQ